MPKKAAKPALPKFLSWDEADAAGLELLRAQSQIEKAEAALKAAIARAKENHKAAIQQPTLARDLLLAGVEKFVSGRRHELDGRSRVLTHVMVGYRKRPPSVVKLLDTWGDVLSRVIGLGKRCAGFLRTKSELDKGAIAKAWSEGSLTLEQLAELGVAIDDSGEDFFCEALTQTVASPN